LTSASLSRWRADAVSIFHAAIAAVDPTQLVVRHLVRDGQQVAVEVAGRTPSRWHAPTLVVGAGKAAARMAAGCERVLGAETVRGEVIVAEGCGVDLGSITVTEAGHPLPDARGEAAARRIVERIGIPGTGGILCLISGGASSLLACPRPPLSLEDKLRVTELLLACGADIHELNTVRKHLSTVKGGGLLRHVGTAPMTALIISDVVGDDPSTIGSGPTAPDATTFRDACAVLERYGLTDRVPHTVTRLLEDGVNGRAQETVKPGDREADRCCNVIIGSNHIALEAAAQAARTLGYDAHIEAGSVVGDTTEAAGRFASRIHDFVHTPHEGRALCLLAGGETTVQVRGPGRGGRNQEFALALVTGIAGQGIVALSAGTDGIDGPTPAAGAFVDGTTLERAATRNLHPAAALRRNDSYTFFSRLGDLFECGPTGTNVMDIKIVLAQPVPGPT
jgi:glycerate 2-kinase